MFIIQEIVGPIMDYFDNASRLSATLVCSIVVAPMIIIAACLIF